MKNLKDFPKSILLLWAFLLFGSMYLFKGTMDTYPSYLHAWTQSDRLAIAQNFQHNGFDFFHPATYNLLTKDGITQVDFPIHDYLVAIIGKISNTSLVTTFRWYNLIWSIVGFSFLYLSILKLNASSIRALFITLFIATLPFYVYYQNGFLPSSTALSTLFVGLYFLIRGLQKEKNIDFVLSALFIGLSALTRSTFVFQLMGFALVVVYSYIHNRKKAMKFLWPYLLMVTVFAAYYLYNKSLAKEYGSMFLTEFLNISSFDDFLRIINQASDRWSNQIFSPFHAVILFTTLIAALLQHKNASKRPHAKTLGLLLLVSIFSSITFFFLMGQQFVDHDYYYLSVLVPTLTYFLIFINQYLTIDKKFYTPIVTVCGIFIFYFFSQSKQVQKERYTAPWDDKIDYAYRVYKEAQQDIIKWGIKDSDTLTILESYSTNIPFTLWNKKGYTNLNSKAEIVDSILNFPKQYVVMIDSFFRLYGFKSYPELIDRLTLRHTNGQVSFYTDHPNDTSAEDFFKHHIFSTHLDFNKVGNADGNFGGSKVIAFEDKMVHQIDAKVEYSLTYVDTLKDLLSDQSIQISLVADYFPTDTANSVQLVCQTGDYYFTHYLENTLDFSNEWKTKQYTFKIAPSKFKENSEIKIYYWNPEGKEIYIDNYHLIIYQ